MRRYCPVTVSSSYPCWLVHPVVVVVAAVGTVAGCILADSSVQPCLGLFASPVWRIVVALWKEGMWESDVAVLEKPCPWTNRIHT